MLLPPGANLLGVTTNRNQLYVRECYKKLHEAIEAYLSTRGPTTPNGVLVTGSPGVGKVDKAAYEHSSGLTRQHKLIQRTRMLCCLLSI